VVCNDGISCRPCFDKCSHKQPVCMQSVRANRVAEALKAMSRDLDSLGAGQRCLVGGQVAW
jgi:hypothetical protein